MANMFQPNSSPATSTGSGGPKNYLAAITTSNGSNTGNGDFELNALTGWSKGNVSLTSALPTGVPTFGSGSSGNLTLSVISASQLAGSFSLSYASSAATTAGDFVASDAFNIDTEDQAKVLTFKFYYTAHSGASNANWSGTSSNSFSVAIWDVTNSAWIIPAGIFSMTQSTGVGYSTGTFQTTSNSTQYRIVVYNSVATLGAATLYFDDFFIGPQTAPLGPIMTDWIAYTPTGAWNTNTTYTGFYKRLGDSIVVRFKMALSGAPNATNPTVTIPSGLTIDTTKVASTTNVNGWGGRANGVVAAAASVFSIGYSTTTAVILTYQNSITGGAGLVDATHPATFANGDQISGEFMMPIVGWSSNVQMSNDTDTRVVAMRANGATGSLSGSYADITWTTIVNDSHGAMGSISYTIPVTGFYDIAAQILTTGTFALNGSAGIQILKNGSTAQEADFVAGGAITGNVAVPLVVNAIFCNAGDTLKIQFKSAATLPTVVTSANDNFFTVSRRSGPSVIAATESVNARYFASATTISGSLATISWTTKDYDSHNAMSAGTYTIPTSGKYQINSAVAIAGTFALNATSNIQIQKNGTVVSETLNDAGGIITNSNVSVSDIVSCVAGDTIRVQVLSSATGPSIVSSNSKNFFSIARVGN